MDENTPAYPPSQVGRATAPSRIPCHRAQTLTQGGTVAHVDLNGQTYTLRITRTGKLILTK